MGGLRIFVVVGIPIIIASLMLMIGLYFFFPKIFSEIFPCFTQLKPDTQIINVPVVIETISTPSTLTSTLHDYTTV
jgi:hypothetical protein